MKRILRLLFALFCSFIATSCITIPLSFILPNYIMPTVAFFVGMICGSITIILSFDWINGD